MEDTGGIGVDVGVIVAVGVGVGVDTSNTNGVAVDCSTPTSWVTVLKTEVLEGKDAVKVIV